MTHEILGEIERPTNDVFDGVARIHFGGRVIEIRMIRDGQPFEATMERAAEVVRQLADLDGRAKRVASAELRETYNGGWNEYDQVQEDGSVKSVSNPQLTESEFEAKLTLNSLDVTGGQMITFFYDDENMFWGHSVVVTSLSGIDFREAHAELFG